MLRISENVRAYAYLILSSQASARSGIVVDTVSALTPQSAFLNNFENVVNRRVDIIVQALSEVGITRAGSLWDQTFLSQFLT